MGMVKRPGSSDSYMTLAGESEGRIREKASRFIGLAFPIADEDAFKARLVAIAREHFSARHHCYAWVLGMAGERFRANDAGEPDGTAGRPILRQLQGASLTHAAIVVVRYFGGTLLGKAGLVRAYADTARAALESNTIIERIITVDLTVICGYEQVELLRTEIARCGGEMLESTFTDRCALRIALPRSLAPALAEGWRARGIAVDQPK